MFRGDDTGYLDPLRVCSLSGESQVDIGISEPATNAKFGAIIKQRRRTNNRTSVLNDVEKARLDLLIKRIDGERAVTQTILNRQKKKVQNSLISIEDHKKVFQKRDDDDQAMGHITAIIPDRKSKRKRLTSPAEVSSSSLNVTRVELKEKTSKESEKESKGKMPMLQPLKHVFEEKRKQKQANNIYKDDKHLTAIRFPAIGEVLYEDVKPDVTRGQPTRRDVRLPRAWSEPDSINSCTGGTRRKHKKRRKGRKRGMSLSE